MTLLEGRAHFSCSTADSQNSSKSGRCKSIARTCCPRSMRSRALRAPRAETTTEDLRNAIRGSVLQSLRYMQDKHPLYVPICSCPLIYACSVADKDVLEQFVTFVDSAAALTFFEVASYHGLTLDNRRLKTAGARTQGPRHLHSRSRCTLARRGACTLATSRTSIPSQRRS